MSHSKILYTNINLLISYPQFNVGSADYIYITTKYNATTASQVVATGFQGDNTTENIFPTGTVLTLTNFDGGNLPTPTINQQITLRCDVRGFRNVVISSANALQGILVSGTTPYKIM